MTVIATAVQPQVQRVAGRHRPRRADVHDRHAAATSAPRYPDAELYFITGADALANIFTWRDVDELFALAHFVGLHPARLRDGPRHARATCPRDRITLVEIPALAISSTDCRERTRSGEPVWYLVPDGVVQYIAKHDLYPRSHVLRHDRHRPRRRARPHRRPRGRGQAGPAHHRLRRLRAARDHRRVPARLRDQRAPGQGDRRRDRGQAPRDRRQADPPRGRARRPLGAASTTATSSCTCSTRRSAASTRSSGCGATARRSRCRPTWSRTSAERRGQETSRSRPVATSKTNPRTESVWGTCGSEVIRAMLSRTSSSRSVNDRGFPRPARRRSPR